MTNLLTPLERLEEAYLEAVERLGSDDPYLPMLAAQLRDLRGNRGKSGLDEYFSGSPVSFRKDE